MVWDEGKVDIFPHGKLFVSSKCPNCPSVKVRAKEYFKEKNWVLFEYDVTTIEGEAEAAIYGLKSVPCVLLFLSERDLPVNITNDFVSNINNRCYDNNDNTRNVG